MSFPQYLTYIDPGVQWMDRIPSHWRSGSLRWLSRRFSGGTPDKNIHAYWEGGTIPWLNSGAVNQALITEPSTLISVSGFKNSSAKWIPSGALVMALAGQGKTKGIVAQLAIPSTCNQSMAAIVPTSEMQPRFLLWWLQSNYQNIRNMAGGDMRDGLNLDLLGEIPCPIPPLAEQTAIAGFLDGETTKIDALVEDQKRLVELLKEKREAMISHAVTKGLNPNAPMKDSGVDWLGKVPRAWTVRSLRTLSSVVRGASPRPAGDPRFFDGDYIPWVTVAEITKDAMTNLTETETCLTEAGAQHSRLFQTGTVIYSNSGATLGVAKILGFNACANDGVVGFESLSDLVDPIFLCHYLCSLTATIRAMVKQGSGQPNLNTSLVKAIPIALPSSQEQLAICSHIEDVTTQFDLLSSAVEDAMTLLQERRTALISAAVTGKIDVRAKGTVTPPELALA